MPKRVTSEDFRCHVEQKEIMNTKVVFGLFLLAFGSSFLFGLPVVETNGDLAIIIGLSLLSLLSAGYMASAWTRGLEAKDPAAGMTGGVFSVLATLVSLHVLGSFFGSMTLAVYVFGTFLVLLLAVSAVTQIVRAAQDECGFWSNLSHEGAEPFSQIVLAAMIAGIVTLATHSFDPGENSYRIERSRESVLAVHEGSFVCSPWRSLTRVQREWGCQVVEESDEYQLIANLKYSVEKGQEGSSQLLHAKLWHSDSVKAQLKEWASQYATLDASSELDALELQLNQELETLSKSLPVGMSANLQLLQH